VRGRSRRLEVAGVVRAGVRGAVLCCAMHRGGVDSVQLACLVFAADLSAKPQTLPGRARLIGERSAVARILLAHEPAMATEQHTSQAAFFTRVQSEHGRLCAVAVRRERDGVCLGPDTRADRLALTAGVTCKMMKRRMRS
jgi:hypothetical protein